MIERMMEQKRAITAYSSDHGHFLCPTPNEWDLAGKLVETLKPLEEVTLELSKADSSASCILPSIGVLKSVLQAEGPHTAGIQTARKAMLQSLEDRFINLNQTKEVVLACLLDPRYKHRPLNQETLSQAKSRLQEEMQSQTSEETKLATITEEEKDPKRRRVGTESIVDFLFENMLAASISEEEESDDVLVELERYMREAVIDRKRSCPLEWWRNNSSHFKRLAKFAQKYLRCPPSSVPSERVFSTVGNIYDDKRRSLKGDNAEKLCFLHYNLPLLDWTF
nr:zinc finger BED domain-containing protein 4-like [Nothobranchius furzeri]